MKTDKNLSTQLDGLHDADFNAVNIESIAALWPRNRQDGRRFAFRFLDLTKFFGRGYFAFRFPH